MPWTTPTNNSHHDNGSAHSNGAASDSGSSKSAFSSGESTAGSTSSSGTSPQAPNIDWAVFSTPALTRLLEEGLAELATRMSSPRVRDDFAEYQTSPQRAAQDWGVNTTNTSADAGTTPTGAHAPGEDARNNEASPDADGCTPASQDTTHPTTSAASAASCWCPDPDSSLPTVLNTVQRLSRLVEASHTQLAGLVGEAFTDDTHRARTLGIPAGKTVYKDAADYLRQTTQESLSHAKQRLQIASGTLTAEPDPITLTARPAPRPVLAAATTHAQVTAGGAWIITRTLEDFAHTAATTGADQASINEILARGEHELVTHAAALDDDGLSAVVKRWTQRSEAELGYDGTPPNEHTARAKRGIRRLYKDRYGNTHYKIITGDADSELLETVIHAANNPAAHTQEDHNESNQDLSENTAAHEAATSASNDAEAGDNANTATADPDTADAHLNDEEQGVVVDERSWEQKALDGVLAVLTAGLRAPERVLSDHGGARPQVTVTIDLHTMIHQAHTAGLLPEGFNLDIISEYGKPGLFLCEGTYTGPIRPSEVRHLLCEADLIPVVLGGEGQVLDMGTKRRFFDRYLRKALGVRDGGCAAPGCTAPLSWCQAHHVVPARDDGATSIENGVMLCRHDHALADAGEWVITFEHGIPYFTAPKYRDPSQTPRRNTYWRQQFF